MIAKRLGLYFIFCSWSAGWNNHVLEFSSLFLLESTVNLEPISDQPLLLDCWLNKLCGWIKQTSSWSLLEWTTKQESIWNQPLLNDCCLNQLSGWINQDSSWFPLEWSTRNKHFWLIQPHWNNSPDISDAGFWWCTCHHGHISVPWVIVVSMYGCVSTQLRVEEFFLFTLREAALYVAV
jgi:hypothetical protein